MLRESLSSVQRQEPVTAKPAVDTIPARQTVIRNPLTPLRRLVSLGSFGQESQLSFLPGTMHIKRETAPVDQAEEGTIATASEKVVPPKPLTSHKRRFTWSRQTEVTGTNETNTSTKKPATNFKEMLDTSKGNPYQRLVKWWIKPKGNPEKTIKLYERLQVHRLQNLAISLYQRRTKKADLKRGYVRQTNYTMHDHSLASMVDMATNGTVFNEFIHIYHMFDPVPFFVVGAILGPTNPVGALFLAGSTAFILFNLGLVLAQRYARAKLNLVIDRAIQKGRFFEVGKFPNRRVVSLALKLPEHTKRVKPWYKQVGNTVAPTKYYVFPRTLTNK